MPPVALSFPGRSRALLRALVAALPALLSAIPLAAGASLPGAAQAADAAARIEQFLLSQSAGLPGKVSVSIDAPAVAGLPPCAALEPFLPSGARPWGRLSVGLRCNTEQPWTRYVSAHVAVVGPYYVAARPINAGQELTPADTQMREGDLTSLPGGVVVDAAQLSGVVASNRIASGAPLRRELLHAVALVQRGQTVKVMTQGAGFMVSSEGKAMTSAPAGALIQVKMPGGQLLSGIVRPDGMVQRPP